MKLHSTTIGTRVLITSMTKVLELPVAVRNVKKGGKKKNRRKQQRRRKNHVKFVGKRKGEMRAHSDSVAAYRVALENPFSVKAIGARVPDSYCFPTVTYHLRSTYTFTSSSTGTGTALFLPSPCFTCISTYSGTYAAPTRHFDSGTYFANNQPATYLVSPTTMSTYLSEYRTVSWGIRLIAKDSAFTSKGKVWLALIPTTNNAPSWNTMNTVTAASLGVVSEYCAGLDMTYAGTSIMNYPSVRVFSMQDLLRGEVQVSCTPLSASFYDFKGTTDRSNLDWNSGQILADEGVFNNATGLVNATAGGRKDIASLRGGMAVLLTVTGCPASTNEFDVELVYHLEGSPNLSGTGGPSTGLFPSAQKVVDGSTSVVESVISMVRRTVPAIRILRDALSTDGGTRGVVQAALSGMSRLAITN